MSQLVKSHTAGFITGLSYILIAKLLDKKLGPRVANIVGLVCGSVVNFFMQSYIFNGKHHIKHIDQKICGKYVASELIVMISNQILFTLIFVKKFNVTITRILIAIFVGIVISYPVRKYWVFKIKKNNDS